MRVELNRYFVSDRRVIVVGPFRDESRTYQAKLHMFGPKGLIVDTFALTVDDLHLHRQMWVQPGDMLTVAGKDVTFILNDLAYSQKEKDLVWKISVLRQNGKTIQKPQAVWKVQRLLGELVFPNAVTGTDGEEPAPHLADAVAAAVAKREAAIAAAAR